MSLKKRFDEAVTVGDLWALIGQSAKSAYGTTQDQFGRTAVFTSNGGDPIVAANRPEARSENLVSVRRKNPRPWVVSTKGLIKQTSQVSPTTTYPFTVFRVQWQVQGVSYTTFVDGYSDQFLTVFAEEVLVFAEWDFENIDRMTTGGSSVRPIGAMNLPNVIELSASLSESEGGTTLAKRTLFATTDNKLMTIPYAARDFRTRAPFTDGQGNIARFFCEANTGGIILDEYSAVVVQASHDSGDNLQVPSMANQMQYVLGVPVAQWVGIEFRLEP